MYTLPVAGETCTYITNNFKADYTWSRLGTLSLVKTISFRIKLKVKGRGIEDVESVKQLRVSQNKTI